MSNDIERQFSKSKEYYKILGLNSDCTDEQIKQSYLTLCKRYHPDNKITGNKEKFILLREAYDIVKDANARIIYDRFLDSRGASSHATYAQTRASRHDGPFTPHKPSPPPFWERQEYQQQENYGKEYYKFKEPGWQPTWRREYQESMKRPFEDRHGHRYNKSFGGRNMVSLTIAVTAFIYLFIGQSLVTLAKSSVDRSRKAQRQEELLQYNSFEEYKAALDKKDTEAKQDGETKQW